jgi:hypothetical protein
MWLLDSNTMKLREFIKEDIYTLKYAVLSHTWGEDKVGIWDMKAENSHYVNKQGFLKIKYCCEQAKKDKINWVWIDTCCIDRFSSVELSEAINSMFRLYSCAEVCYAYIFDIPDDLARNATADNSTLESQFKGCKWFRRGWTLQELLAPKSVLFYSQGWVGFGNRDHWKTQISDVTGINEDALGGDIKKLKSFSIAQRMCWTSGRTTTRPEDIAYCLLGIFDVNMPLLYGEGGKKAFFRLQEEIMKNSDDQSLFAWATQASTPELELQGLLASSPQFFRGSGDIRSFRRWDINEPFLMTNKGLKIQLPLKKYTVEDYDDIWLAYLNCYREHENEDTVLGVLVKLLFPGGDQFKRWGKGLQEISLRPLLHHTLPDKKTLYIQNELIHPHQTYIRNTNEPFSFTLFEIPPKYKLSENFGGVMGFLNQSFHVFSQPKITDGFWIQPDAWVNWRVVCKLVDTSAADNRSCNFFLILGNEDKHSRPWCALKPDEGQSPHEVWMKVRSGKNEITGEIMPNEDIRLSVKLREKNHFFGEKKTIEVKVACEKWKLRGKKGGWIKH